MFPPWVSFSSPFSQWLSRGPEKRTDLPRATLQSSNWLEKAETRKKERLLYAFTPVQRSVDTCPLDPEEQQHSRKGAIPRVSISLVQVPGMEHNGYSVKAC